MITTFKRRTLLFLCCTVMAALFAVITTPAQAQLDPRLITATLPAAAPPSPMPPAVPAEQPVMEDAESEECLPQPFGQSLFDGAIQKSRNTLVSAKQRVVPGDRVSLAVWGAVEVEEIVTVDSQGFMYVKGVGPVHVAGKSADELSAHVRREINNVFKDDVRVYAQLEQNAGTPIMVTGAVTRPGQYFGSVEDNVIVYLQRAGGIVAGQGSYRDITILRDGSPLATLDLYPFLKSGYIQPIDWRQGDTIVVGDAGAHITVTGAVRRCAVFEFANNVAAGSEINDIAQPEPGVTHAILNGFRNQAPHTQVLSLAALATTALQDGDRLDFYAAPQSDKITVSIEGPIQGNSLMVIPQHTRLSQVLDHIPVNAEVSDTSSVFLKRKSVAKMQKEALDESLRRLLHSALTAPASSDGEALIRAKEAELIEKFVAQTRNIQQEGRIVVMQSGTLQDLPLEDGDVIVIPRKTSVVSIEGEVILPRALVARPDANAKDYAMMAGGYTERALKNDFIVIKPNGDAIRGSKPMIEAGDRIMVLPRVDSKNIQTTKDIVQILYQIAVGAGVLLSI